MVLLDQTDGIRNLAVVNACMAILGFFAEVGQNLIDRGCCCKPKGKTDFRRSSSGGRNRSRSVTQWDAAATHRHTDAEDKNICDGEGIIKTASHKKNFWNVRKNGRMQFPQKRAYVPQTCVSLCLALFGGLELFWKHLRVNRHDRLHRNGGLGFGGALPIILDSERRRPLRSSLGPSFSSRGAGGFANKEVRHLGSMITTTRTGFDPKPALVVVIMLPYLY